MPLADKRHQVRNALQSAIHPLIEQGNEQAQVHMEQLREQAKQSMHQALDTELTRLQNLRNQSEYS